ncbi:hypothetical protein [Chitinophaga sancti]|uniref:Uncharacterized protein n=1 Tax=Chitinophaga sancti TaxID=1004 RepID=A0A1K1T4W5_9BACT|nr:hypothetical protein [Chitinophaga sancti]WQD61446.1 hypothetical protein U0033_26575 [Chitinophaga sancti]WQD61762.1 hypothetical protein U0033_28170 [Chitinophaga sancti]WQG92675.1 hypothetical protein SR876_14245 [Chitinophaga sancti]WQG93000.1 hypothetical protein SR876_15880 [Chitinophaga sancti]SFW91375.1 hypothetical protein SAMN05661012_06772 [Chitinophaga sancti]
MIQELLDLGYIYEKGNDYYYKEYGPVRIGIKKSEDKYYASTNPFVEQFLIPLENIEEVKKYIQRIETEK